MAVFIEGRGKNVPPEKRYVIIYFLQKGKSEIEACRFYDFYNEKKWKNLYDKLISNWKLHAWNWICN